MLANIAKKSYAELVELVDGDIGFIRMIGESGAEYEIEIDIFWEKEEGGNVRFDAVLSADFVSEYFPMQETFIKNSNDELIEEDYEKPLF